MLLEEESLIYAINIAGLRPLLENNPKIGWYLAQSLAAGKLDRTIVLESNKRSGDLNYSSELLQVISVEQSKDPVTCSPQTIIRDAAKIMRQQRVGSIIIVDNEHYHYNLQSYDDKQN